MACGKARRQDHQPLVARLAIGAGLPQLAFQDQAQERKRTDIGAEQSFVAYRLLRLESRKQRRRRLGYTALTKGHRT